MGPVHLQFLGSGDAFGSDGRFQTCLRLTGGGGELLIDCGVSSLIAMKRAGVDPSRIGEVVISHLHGDHFGGLPFLILDGQFSRRTAPLVVAGPPGIEARVRAAMEVLFPGSSSVARRFAVEFVDLVARVTRRIGSTTVTPLPVEHPSGAPAYALRIEYGGRSIAYSGDTAWSEALVEAARGVDLFVCEAYSFAKPIPYHLDYRTLLAHRPRVECRRIVLTHLGPEMLGHLDEVELECAQDGAIVSL